MLSPSPCPQARPRRDAPVPASGRGAGPPWSGSPSCRPSPSRRTSGDRAFRLILHSCNAFGLSLGLPMPLAGLSVPSAGPPDARMVLGPLPLPRGHGDGPPWELVGDTGLLMGRAFRGLVRDGRHVTIPATPRPLSARSGPSCPASWQLSSSSAGCSSSMPAPWRARTVRSSSPVPRVPASRPWWLASSTPAGGSGLGNPRTLLVTFEAATAA
jgi:hypothetical protein